MRLFTLFGLLFTLLPCTCVRAQANQPESFGKGSTIYTHGRHFVNGGAKALNEDLYPFYHGVASGDPLEDRVIIWTRVTPDSLDGAAVTVNWRMATDPELKQIVAEGSVDTDGDRDYTVKVDVTGLSAGTTYYYGFTALERNSLTGKTKTTPTAAQVDHLKFGVVSCSNYQAGYFNAYGRLAERTDLDAIIHLGDYIYEYRNFVYGNEAVWDERLVEPNKELITLFDYRTRYSTYRLDSNLMRMHQQHPMIAVWDDHESANDSYENGANNHTPSEEGSWEERKDNSRQAYFEWLPIRESDDQSIYRTISYGNLADLIMLDTRLEGRDKQPLSITDSDFLDSSRTILGTEQRDWFFEQLGASTAKWKIVGQQVIFSEFNVGWAGSAIGLSFEEAESEFLDIWDGYPADRRRVTDFLREQAIDNVVLLTGDFHSSFAFEVAEPPVNLEFRELPGFGQAPFYLPSQYDPATGAGAVAVEFATPSITSANFDENISTPIALVLQQQVNQPIMPSPQVSLGNPNPHMKYAELTEHGYFLLDVREDSVQADFFYGPILVKAQEERFAAGFSSGLDTNQLVQVTVPAEPKTIQDVPAPADPPAFVSSIRKPATDIRVLSLSPNPTDGGLNLQYALSRGGQVSIDLLDAGGRLLKNLQRVRQPAGLYTLEARLDGLATGTYFVRIETPGGVSVQPVVKY